MKYLEKILVVCCPELVMPVLSVLPHQPVFFLQCRLIRRDVELYWSHVRLRVPRPHPVGCYLARKHILQSISSLQQQTDGLSIKNCYQYNYYTIIILGLVTSQELGTIILFQKLFPVPNVPLLSTVPPFASHSYATAYFSEVTGTFIPMFHGAKVL